MTTIQGVPDHDWTPYDMLPVGVIVIRSDYTVLSWNSCIADWTGISPGEIDGTNLLDRFPGLDKPRYRARIGQVFSGGPPVLFSAQFHPHLIPAPLPGGEMRIERATVLPIRSGTSFHAMIVIEDVTDLTRQVRAFRGMKHIAEKELGEKEEAQKTIVEALEFNKAIVSNSPIGILILAPGGRCISANASAGTIFGAPPDVLKSQDFFSLESWNQSGLLGMARRALDEEKTIPGEVNLETSFGRNVWLSLVCTPFHAADGLHLLVMFEDITERKRAEQALVLANKKLNLLSSITRHDIQNQLVVLQSYLSLIQEYLQDPEALDYLSRSEKAVEIIGLEIEFTRSYQDIGVKSPIWQNIGSIVRGSLDPLLQKNIPVEISLPPVEVYADPLLPRVFYNLAENAVRHGESMTWFRVGGTMDGNGFVIVCEDDGGGVPDENKEKIFRRDYFRHTGLGLFLSRDILSITGITIRETGVWRTGARFEIHVPANQFRPIR